jgi:RHS repeat-associated protein
MTTRQALYNGKTSSTSCPTENYDALNRPLTWSQTGPNGFYKSSHYQYDHANRETATWREEDGHRGESFEYERTNQLKKATYNALIAATASPSPTPPNATPTPPPNATPTPPPPTPPPGQVAPVAIEDDGNYGQNVTVTMSTDTAGATIFYRISGTGFSNPTHDANGQPTNGTLIYSGPLHVAPNHVAYIRAVGYKSGSTDSAINELLVDNTIGGGDAPSGPRIVTYTYTPDKLNRSSMTDNNVTTVYAPNALNQYRSTTGNSFSYDNNFNLTHTIGFNGIYDAGNLLVAASNGGSGEAQQTVAGFVYDGLGRCVKRTFNGAETILVYDGWKPIAEWDATVPEYFQAWNVYGPGPDEILLRQGGKYGYVRFHLDRHGNVAFLVDNDGVIQERYTYDVFGKPKIMDAAGTERPFSYYGHCFLFQGREYIRELGVYDYRHRFYHPGLGNFIQVDPLGLQTEGAKLSAEQTALYGDGAPATFSSSELNLYRYCHNDPVNNSDPLGLYAPQIEKFSDSDKKLIEGQIKEWKETSRTFREEYEKWESDKVNRYIRPAIDPGNTRGNRVWNSADPQDNGFARHKGPGGTVYYDPHNRKTAQGRDRDPFYGLAHELGHLIDWGYGNYPISVVPTAAETKRGENIAIGWERDAQRACEVPEANLRPFLK